MIDVVARRRSNPSPLRYPGGKASLADFFESAINALGLSKPTYVEPYAGGAGAGLALLYRGVVGRVVINDLDRSIYAVWDSMLHRTDDFLQRLERAPLTVDEWKRQREIYRRRDDGDLDPQDLGFATFYLNRTNRSGVLGGGIIGGLKQTGTYRMDARFNRETLRARIEQVAEHRSKILVSHQDGVLRLRHWLPKENVFAYVDPPYYEKGSFLYLNSFNDPQHHNLANWLNSLADANWVLTYDMAEPIRAMYTDRTMLDFNLHYSANRRELASELMVVSDPLADAFAKKAARTESY
ncbi:DNA adenine methylase [Jiangella mangrovi]|uniref:site-specific DNA-methyltransferase (adenine-specific) n=1 Tax=Jiangella mangrovi TaxID=1524084 RepID=A0A7W9GM41_9ACTN|nr:DNA adenine methylase [Jiangella mangrovi]